MTDWSKPIPVDEVTLAFPAHITGKLLPPRDEIPEEFFKLNNPFQRAAATWFYGGVDLERSTVALHEGHDIDVPTALRQCQACLGSFEPSHEHKMAGVAYLLSLFFAEVDFVSPEKSRG